MMHRKLAELGYEEDRYFAGFGARSLGTCRPVEHIEVERYASAEGQVSYMAYRPSALARAARRSLENGGGYRGLCSQHLRSGEAVALAECSTVADAAWALRGRR